MLARKKKPWPIDSLPKGSLPDVCRVEDCWISLLARITDGCSEVGVDGTCGRAPALRNSITFLLRRALQMF